jgi:hypothetical protein
MTIRQKKSDAYYFKNEKSIQEILKLYDGLYQTQKLTLGFSDRGSKHVGFDIITDSIRYSLNNEESERVFYMAIDSFKYDTANLRRLYLDMYRIKCIWLGKEHFFYQGIEQEVVYLTFRSAKFGNPFLDRKYYALVIFDPGFINPETTRFIEKNGYKRVNDHVYYTITDSFR